MSYRGDSGGITRIAMPVIFALGWLSIKHLPERPAKGAACSAVRITRPAPADDRDRAGGAAAAAPVAPQVSAGEHAEGQTKSRSQANGSQKVATDDVSGSHGVILLGIAAEHASDALGEWMLAASGC